MNNVTNKAITYTDEFKQIFITDNENGKLAREIFEEYGFDVDIIGIDRVRSSGKRWRANYRNNGVCGLTDTRRNNSGRPTSKELSLEEKYARLEAQNNLLKAENELLKKLDMMERMKRKK